MVTNGDEQYIDIGIYRIDNGVEVEEQSGILYGGENTYSANEYKLSFISKDADVVIDHDVTVLLTVRTVEAPYYAELKTKITLQYSQFKDFIAYQGVSKEEDNEKVVSLIYDIGMQVIAEGVETIEQANKLSAVGCDCAQGFFFAKPMSLREFDEFHKAILKNNYIPSALYPTFEDAENDLLP